MRPEGACEGAYYDPLGYQLSVTKLFDYIRNRFGFNVELCHDVHEHLDPIEAVRLAKELEPYRLFFYEDSLAPEQVEWFEIMRKQTHTPIAMGELFNNPREFTPLIANKLIDFIRCHVSQIGGITPAKKLANFCEAFSVRTAWHGPGDTSPVGPRCGHPSGRLQLELRHPGVGGLQAGVPGRLPRLPRAQEGFMSTPTTRPGLGIDIDEELAKKFPCSEKLPTWTNCRRPDGTLNRPLRHLERQPAIPCRLAFLEGGRTMQRICLCLLAALLLLCAGCAAPLQGPADLPEDADALVLLDVQARGQDVVATVSAAAFAADGTSYTYSKEIPYAFALADGFTATLRAADGTMQAYDEPAAPARRAGGAGRGRAPARLRLLSFDESAALLALNERA